MSARSRLEILAWLEDLRSKGSFKGFPPTVLDLDGNTISVGYVNDAARGDVTYAVLNGYYEDTERGEQRALEVEILDGVVVDLNELRIYLNQEGRQPNG
jgi:hypothetical protein